MLVFTSTLIRLDVFKVVFIGVLFNLLPSLIDHEELIQYQYNFMLLKQII